MPSLFCFIFYHDSDNYNACDDAERVTVALLARQLLLLRYAAVMTPRDAVHYVHLHAVFS